jgi:hypothetical protein
MSVQSSLGGQTFTILPVLVISFGCYSLILIYVYLVLEMRRSNCVISWPPFFQLTAQPLSLVRRFTIIDYAGKFYSNAANIFI